MGRGHFLVVSEIFMVFTNLGKHYDKHATLKGGHLMSKVLRSSNEESVIINDAIAKNKEREKAEELELQERKTGRRNTGKVA